MSETKRVSQIMIPNFKTIDGVTRVAEALKIMKDEKLSALLIEPRDGSTLITLTCSRARGPWLSRAINNAIGPRLIAARLRGGLEHLRAVVEQELADGRLVIPEPNDGVLSQVETAIAASLPGEASE